MVANLLSMLHVAQPPLCTNKIAPPNSYLPGINDSHGGAILGPGLIILILCYCSATALSQVCGSSGVPTC